MFFFFFYIKYWTGPRWALTSMNVSENCRVINLPMSVFSDDGNKKQKVGQDQNPPLTFHAPSFGDEDFDIPPINLPNVNYSCYAQPNSYPGLGSQNSPQFAHPQQPVSHNGTHYSQPLSQNLQTNNGLSYRIPNNNLINGQETFAEPQFPPPNFEIPDIVTSNSLLNIVTSNSVLHLPGSNGLQTFSHVRMAAPNFQRPLIPQNTLNTLGGFGPPTTQAQMKGQGGKGPSPTGSTTTSPSRDSISEDSSSEDSLPLNQLALKRVAPSSPAPPPAVTNAKKPKTPKKRKKKDPNEPQKPVSAYALFFRDTQAAIKSQNPNASFGEVSKIVASMWDGLDDEHKSAYKKKTEAAKKEYLKQLAAYRASLVSQGALDSQDGEKPKMGVPYQPPQSIQRQSMSSPAMSSQSLTMSMSTMPLSHMASSPMMNSQAAMMPPHQPMPGLPSSMQQSHHTMVHMTNLAPRLSASQMAPHNGMNNMTGGHGFTLRGQMMGSPGHSGPGVSSRNQLMCTRHGCPNPAIENPGWDNEYCSNECVVSHCRDVFSQWVSARQSNGPYASVK